MRDTSWKWENGQTKTYILESFEIEYPEEEEERRHEEELEEESLESFPPEEVELGPGPVYEEHQH